MCGSLAGAAGYAHKSSPGTANCSLTPHKNRRDRAIKFLCSFAQCCHCFPVDVELMLQCHYFTCEIFPGFLSYFLQSCVTKWNRRQPLALSYVTSPTWRHSYLPLNNVIYAHACGSWPPWGQVTSFYSTSQVSACTHDWGVKWILHPQTSVYNRHCLPSFLPTNMYCSPRALWHVSTLLGWKVLYYNRYQVQGIILYVWLFGVCDLD